MKFDLPQKPRPKAANLRAPKHFSDRAKRIWNDVLREYELSSENLALLRVALENLDLGDAAREQLRKEGSTNEEGRKHPALDAAKQHDGMFMRAVRQLGLDVVNKGTK